MRYTRMRFDIWLCLLLAFAVSLGTVKLTELVLPSLYQRHVEEHTVADGAIGGKAGPEVFRAQSQDSQGYTAKPCLKKPKKVSEAGG